MKTIGLIGGMSWESTVPYYQMINREVHNVLGGHHSAKCVLHSVDFHEIELLQASGQWERCAEILIQCAQDLQSIGADCIVLCTNTMHKVAAAIEASIDIPLLHIAKITVESLVKADISRVILLGTKYTMREDFYTKHIEAAGIDVLLPNDEEIETINTIIFNELCKGVVSPSSKQYYLDVVDRLRREGGQGVILGCTEIGLLIQDGDSDIPFFDTTKIHAHRAANFALTD